MGERFGRVAQWLAIIGNLILLFAFANLIAGEGLPRKDDEAYFLVLALFVTPILSLLALVLSLLDLATTRPRRKLSGTKGLISIAIWVAAFVLVVITALCGVSWIRGGEAAPVIYGITGLILLWYSWETFRIREEQESLGVERSTPRLTIFIEAQGAKEFRPRQPEHTEFIFKVTNVTPIHARLLVLARARTPSGIVSPEGSEYSAGVVWGLQPAETLNAHFPVASITRGFPEDASIEEVIEHPVEEMPLDVSVATYSQSGSLLYVWQREYHVELLHRRSIRVIWPHVRPSTFPPYDFPAELPSARTAGATGTLPNPVGAPPVSPPSLPPVQR